MGSKESKMTRVEMYYEESTLAVGFCHTSFSSNAFSLKMSEASFAGVIDLIGEEESDIDYYSCQGSSGVFSNGGGFMTYREVGLIDESSDESSDDEYDTSSDDEDENVTLYHYTTEKGAQGISKDKMIKASTDKNNDAVFGEGVYLTAMDPYTYSKEDIIRNNYDDGTLVHQSPQFHDKADSAIAVSIPESEVYKVDDIDRDVYLYDGDLNLDLYDHAVIDN